MKTKISYMGAAIAIALTVSSCTKKFDPSSYAPPVNIGGFTSSKQIAPGNLIAHWSFDDNLTDSISKTVGTATNTSFTAGMKGRALQGALNGYVISETPPAVQNLKSFTTMLWFKSELNTGATGLIDIANSNSGWGNLCIFLENGGAEDKGVIQFRVNNKGVLTQSENYSISSPWKKWNHLALSYNETTSDFVIYLNGSRIKTLHVENNGPLTFQNASKMVFGTLQFQTTPSLTTTAGKESWASYLTGQLDEVRIYNKALSIDEIGAISKLESKGK